MDRKKIEEMFRSNPEREKIAEDGVDAMQLLTARMLKVITSEAEDIQEAEGWYISLLMALAKTTATVLYGLSQSSQNPDENSKSKLHDLYVNIIFPSVSSLTYSELNDKHDDMQGGDPNVN